MTKLQTLTLTGIGTMALVIGVLLAGGAMSSAQEGTGTPTPAPTAAPTDDGTEATPAPSDESEDESDQGDTEEDSATEDSEDEDGSREGCAGGGKHLIKEAAAEVLGMSEEDLRAALREGQTLAEIAEAQGMSVEDFTSAVEDNVTATLQEQVNAGEITQEEYDEAIANLQEKLDDIINATPGGAGFFGPRGGEPFGEGL
jgi:hypothetical protein